MFQFFKKRIVSIPVGSHLVSPRGPYSHHGIYVGEGKVVHYSGKSDGLKAGPVKVDSLEVFQNGRGFSIKEHATPKFSGRVVALRAFQRIGEDLYSLIGNNCEHFCEWCIHDQHRSLQVEHGKKRAATFLVASVQLAWMLRGGGR